MSTAIQHPVTEPETETRSVPRVELQSLDTLWFQVAGTLCNLACSHCFISCSPTNHTRPRRSTEHGAARPISKSRAGPEQTNSLVETVPTKSNDDRAKPGLRRSTVKFKLTRADGEEWHCLVSDQEEVNSDSESEVIVRNQMDGAEAKKAGETNEMLEQLTLKEAGGGTGPKAKAKAKGKACASPNAEEEKEPPIDEKETTKEQKKLDANNSSRRPSSRRGGGLKISRKR